MNNELPIVSFETAKLLQNAGFDLDIDKVYHKIDGYLNDKDDEMPDNRYSAPTQALAQMWLRKECGIDIYIYAIHKSWDTLTDFNLEVNVHPINEKYFLRMGYRKPINTYEEALEFGIQKACEYKINQKENGTKGNY